MRPPACRPTPSATLSPNTWKNGSAREPDVVGADRQPGVRLHLADVRGEVPVREHRGARRAGRARGEEQHRELGVVALGLGRHAVAGQELAHGERAGEIDQLVGAGAAEEMPRADRARSARRGPTAGASGFNGTATAPAHSAPR